LGTSWIIVTGFYPAVISTRIPSHTNATSPAVEWAKQLSMTSTGTKIHVERFDVISAPLMAVLGPSMASSGAFRDGWIMPRDTSSLIAIAKIYRYYERIVKEDCSKLKNG
jgi:hypothetical protein